MSAGPALASAPFLAATALVGLAGAAKLARPDDTARALAVAGLPHHRRLVRVGAVAEVAVAVAALAVPSAVTGALVAAAYGAFSVFVAFALVRRWPLSSCGCFGRPDARPGWAHLALDAGGAAAAGLWAAGPAPSLAALLRAGPWGGAPLLLEAAVMAGLAYAIWTDPLRSLPVGSA
jgi:hypothetical protein